MLWWMCLVKGSLVVGLVLSVCGYFVLNGQILVGCLLMEWQNDNNGWQCWCVWLVQGGGFVGLLFDGFDNFYVGQLGVIIFFLLIQWMCWCQFVIGMLFILWFLGYGCLFVSIYLGQLLVFDICCGMVVGSLVDLVDGIDFIDVICGLVDCVLVWLGCLVVVVFVFLLVNGMVVVSVWQLGELVVKLVGLKYYVE